MSKVNRFEVEFVTDNEVVHPAVVAAHLQKIFPGARQFLVEDAGSDDEEDND